MRERIAGLLVFLPIPAVLFLYTRNPLGLTPSMAIGFVVMVTHGLYARPYAQWRASRRCLWSGRPVESGKPVEVRDPLGPIDWQVEHAAAEDRLRRTFGWARRNAWFLRVGVLVPLVGFLAAHWFAASGRLGTLNGMDTINFFRLGIASTVLPFGWLGPRSAPDSEEALSFPSPVHIQALVGTQIMLWLFRIVGVVWLAQALLHFGGRLNLG